MIRIENLHKAFNGQKVLRGVNLMVPRDKITVIIGPSGCGKTSILRHIIGLLLPDRGKIWIDGKDIVNMDRLELNKIRRRFGYLFQHAALFDSMTVYQNISFPLREHTDYKKSQIDRIVAEKLRLVGLSDVERKLPAELSGGMRKRVGLARALALDPEIILYDEPTTGLDPIMTEAIDDLILQTQKRLNVTSIVISHDIPSTFRIADQVAMVYQGQIVEAGDVDSFRATKNGMVREFIEKGMYG